MKKKKKELDKLEEKRYVIQHKDGGIVEVSGISSLAAVNDLRARGYKWRPRHCKVLEIVESDTEGVEQ